MSSKAPSLTDSSIHIEMMYVENSRWRKKHDYSDMRGHRKRRILCRMWLWVGNLTWQWHETTSRQRDNNCWYDCAFIYSTAQL